MIDREVKIILGKTIAGVIVKETIFPLSNPGLQLILVFSDDTYYEFWTDYPSSILSASGPDSGGMNAARDYIKDCMKITYEAYLGEDGQIIEHDKPLQE